MTTRFSNAKLVEAQEEKAKASLTSGLLSRKRQRENEPSKEETMVTSSMAKSQDRCPALPTSSLELIVFPGGGSKAKTTSKISIASFWEDTGIAAQKAYDAISMEDSLMGKPHLELMSSHVHKLVQVYIFVSYAHLCFLFFFFFFFFFFFVFELSPICCYRCWESPCTSQESTWTMIRRWLRLNLGLLLFLQRMSH